MFWHDSQLKAARRQHTRVSAQTIANYRKQFANDFQNATLTELTLPRDSTLCEIEVQITNFDLRGREATITARFIYGAASTDGGGGGATSGILAGGLSLASLLAAHLWIAIVVPIVCLCALALVLRYAALGGRKLKKVAKLGTRQPTTTTSVAAISSETTAMMRPKNEKSRVPPPVPV